MCVFPQGVLRLCQRVSSVHQVFVEPLTSDDWEILVGVLVTNVEHWFSIIQVIAVLLDLKDLSK